MSLTKSIPPTPADIDLLVSIMQERPTVDTPVTHHHSDGIYAREMFIPAGTVIVGKVHKTRHLNILVQGEISIWTVHGKHRIKAPCTFESIGGMQKVGYAHTDVVYMTIHPTDETDQDKLEGLFIEAEEQLPLFPELDFQRLIGTNKLLVGD